MDMTAARSIADGVLINRHVGPRTPAAEAIHAMKHRGENEDFREAMNRLAFGLKDDDKHYHRLRDILLHQNFLPGGRIQSAIGATREVSAYNCMVSGKIEDSFVHGEGCIMDRLKEAAATMRMGCGIGYDFSTLRPKGAMIKRQQTQSSGPLGFIPIFDAVCLATQSAGFRRGAQMGVLRVDHPDIEAYIRMKQQPGVLRGFNLSIAITDEFMEALAAQKPFTLKWGGTDYNEVDPVALWEMVMRSTWDWGEPGVLYIDTINRWNNLYYCEKITATNPCGEQPLPPYGACLLGSWNVPSYLRKTMQGFTLDTESLLDDVRTVVRAMDNVVDCARYPLPQQRAEALTKRRMGLGVAGLANALEACGAPYGSPAFLQMEDKLLKAITRETYLASIELAQEKGTFAMFDYELYPRGKFVQTLDDDVQDKLAHYGIRNSHLTSIAPTGTIAQTADNISGGLEPVFSYSMERDVETPAGKIAMQIEDFAVKFLGVYGKIASEVTAEEHILVQTTAQKHIDSAVSKTCNVDSKMPWEQFKGIYHMAYEGGAKGCTTFNAEGERMGVVRALTTAGPACVIDPKSGAHSCAD